MDFVFFSFSLTKSPSKFNRIWYTEDTNENALIKCFYLPFNNMSCGYGTVTDQCHTILFHGIIMFLISETKSLKCYFSPEEKGTTLTRKKTFVFIFRGIYFLLAFLCVSVVSRAGFFLIFRPFAIPTYRKQIYWFYRHWVMSIKCFILMFPFPFQWLCNKQRKLHFSLFFSQIFVFFFFGCFCSLFWFLFRFNLLQLIERAQFPDVFNNIAMKLRDKFQPNDDCRMCQILRNVCLYTSKIFRQLQNISIIKPTIQPFL